MSNWSSYPSTYRSAEVKTLLAAVQRGDCAAVFGLSGSGKSNLLGFLAHSVEDRPQRVLIDCNRMASASPDGFWQLILRALGQPDPYQSQDAWTCLESSINARLEGPNNQLCLVMDRFDALPPSTHPVIYGRLRSLRDDHKYFLMYIIASRQPVDPRSELAELFFGHMLWLGALSAPDARWSASSYAARAGFSWAPDVVNRLVELSGGYPALLRAACEAYCAGGELNLPSLQAHPAIQRRLDEFWSANPTPEELHQSGLDHISLLQNRGSTIAKTAPWVLDTTALTAKELRLWLYFAAHPGDVCEKDDLIRATWPEDRVFTQGIRDDSLAQLVRRLRQKLMADSGQPQWIQTVPGRGYKYTGR